MEKMSLLLCPSPGCNRKYKKKETLLKHLRNQHQIRAELIHVENVEHVPTKNEKEEEQRRRLEEIEAQRQRQEARIEAERAERERERRQREEEEARRRELEHQARLEAEAQYMAQHREEWLQHIQEMQAIEAERERAEAELSRQEAELRLQSERERLEREREMAELKAQQEREHLAILQRVRENPDDCAVCFDRPSGGAAVIPCGHAYFCHPCLVNWHENYRNRGCPYCRGPITKIQVLIG